MGRPCSSRCPSIQMPVVFKTFNPHCPHPATLSYDHLSNSFLGGHFIDTQTNVYFSSLQRISLNIPTCALLTYTYRYMSHCHSSTSYFRQRRALGLAKACAVPCSSHPPPAFVSSHSPSSKASGTYPASPVVDVAILKFVLGYMQKWSLISTEVLILVCNSILLLRH